MRKVQARASYHCITNRCVKGDLAGSIVYAVESYFNLWRKKYLIPEFLISPSKFVKNMVMQTGYAEKRIVHIPNMVDVEKYVPNSEPGGYMLFAGRLSHEKGIFVLLEAFRGLDIPLRIVGTAGRGRGTAIRRKTWDEARRVRRLQVGRYLAERISGMRFTVIPSTWYENCPMSILEAFAYGKPVVGSRIGGIPELIEEGQTGSLFEAGNAEELREKVTDLWRDRGRIRSMGGFCREEAERRFSPQKRHYAAFLDVYTRAQRADDNCRTPSGCLYAWNPDPGWCAMGCGI